ncbi:MAG: glycosyltransferase family 2 protein [Candidatus Diapherotrites archaeon]
MGKILLYGFHVFLAAIPLFVLGALWWLAGWIFFGKPFEFNILLFASFVLGLFAFLAFLFDFVLPTIFFPPKRELRIEPLPRKVAVGITAYDHEFSIGPCIKEFKKNPSVVKVIVIDNNSRDRTAEMARKAGAIVVREPVQGYGSTCTRALKEASKYAPVVCLVEGDGTFLERDLNKLLAYLENADMVLGTRSTAELVTNDSQVNNWFLRYGNIFMAKLIQLRYWDRLRLTDVGCTYRVIRTEKLKKILPELNITGLQFSPYMTLVALKHDLKVIEVPVSLRARVGESKGVGGSAWKAFRVGLDMWKEILSN